jgi:hypothetical protein
LNGHRIGDLEAGEGPVSGQQPMASDRHNQEENMSTLLPCSAGQAEVGHSFVEIKIDERGHSPGPALSARHAADHLMVLLHDNVRHRGSLAQCSAETNVLECLAGMVHHMVNQWGSRPADLDVLLAGGLVRDAEFSHALAKQLETLRIGGQVLDARSLPVRPLGRIPPCAPADSLHYHPTRAVVELVNTADPPGGRVYKANPEVAVHPLAS